MHQIRNYVTELITPENFEEFEIDCVKGFLKTGRIISDDELEDIVLSDSLRKSKWTQRDVEFTHIVRCENAAEKNELAESFLKKYMK